MNLAQTPLDDIETALRGDGLALDLGIIRARVRARIPRLAAAVQRVYGAFPFEIAQAFCDLTATLLPARGMRRWVQPQILFYLEGDTPFEAFPARTHLPMLEWGLNWAIAQRFTDVLLLHAGVVERDGRAIVLPAMPGSGKSTLTAALVNRGYRLLSDEFGAVEGNSGRLLPAVRPVALKNESISVIRDFAPAAVIGPDFPGTRKGTVAHVAPDRVAVEERHTPAEARLILFPRYEADSQTIVEEMPKSRAFAKLSVNAFNYELRGPAAFGVVARLIDQCDCYQLAYSDLENAIATIGDLLRGKLH
jgi:HprK-related kinase A